MRAAEGFLEGVQGTGADVTEYDAQRAQGERGK